MSHKYQAFIRSETDGSKFKSTHANSIEEAARTIGINFLSKKMRNKDKVRSVHFQIRKIKRGEKDIPHMFNAFLDFFPKKRQDIVENITIKEETESLSKRSQKNKQSGGIIFHNDINVL